MRTIRAATIMAASFLVGACVPGTTTLAPLDDVVDLDAGTSHACAVQSTGTVRCWGMNASLQLGNAALAVTGAYSSNAAVTVTGIGDATQVAVGYDFSCALRSGGTVSCWGAGRWGQLGNGRFDSESQPPTPVLGITGATQITASGGSACALMTGGTIRCWGNNEVGQLGLGTVTPWPPGGVAVPTEVVGISDAVQVDGGGSSTCALLATGIERCWGSGDRGVLGNGSTASSALPLTVVGIDDIVDIDAGGGHSCAVIGDGTARCWGYNEDGRLGDGTRTDRVTPAIVADLTDVASISTGSTDTCARTTSGTAACWGLNQYGELGDGTTVESDRPVAVAGLTGVTDISAGENATCAVRSDHTVWCWGWNYLGQLGDGTNVSSTAPVAVRSFGP